MENTNNEIEVIEKIDLSNFLEYLVQNPEVCAEIITAALAMYLLVSASRDFSREKIPQAKKKILGGSSMLTASAFLAGNMQYALPDLGIFISSNTANFLDKNSEIVQKVKKYIPEKIANLKNLNIAIPVVFAGSIFTSLIVTGIISSIESSIVPFGLGTLAVSYSLLEKKDKFLRRILAIMGGSLIVAGGLNDFNNAISTEIINIKGAILSGVYAVLNFYFTANEIVVFRSDRIQENNNKE